MSLRDEQYRALARARGFLVTLLDPSIKYKTSQLRREAASCLKHFPPLADGTGEVIWSRDPFTEDKEWHPGRHEKNQIRND